MSEEKSFCADCECMTYSIRKSRANFICSRCERDKTLGDFFQYEIKVIKNEF